MLSVVDAIAHQTATRNPEDFIERFSERIQALSANQDLLVRNAWHGVEIEDLVRAQLAPFADLIGSRIVVRGPKLRLNAASAQAIGLALHELTTNAGKYGALSKDTGRLDIGWATDGDIFAMSWAEHDGPPVSVPVRREATRPHALTWPPCRKGGRPTAAMRVRSRTCGKVHRDEIEEELIEIEGATPMCDNRGVPPFRRQRRKSRRVFTADPSVPMWTNVPML